MFVRNAGRSQPRSGHPACPAVQFQRQLGLSRYETAFQILHKLRAGMVRPDRDKIGGQEGKHVEVDETWVGGKTRGEGRGVHHKTLVACAVEVRHRQPGTPRTTGRTGAMPDGSAWPWCPIAQPNRSAALSRVR